MLSRELFCSLLSTERDTRDYVGCVDLVSYILVQGKRNADVVLNTIIGIFDVDVGVVYPNIGICFQEINGRVLRGCFHVLLDACQLWRQRRRRVLCDGGGGLDESDSHDCCGHGEK